MSELWIFLLGFGAGFLVFIVLPISLLALLFWYVGRAKRKGGSKLAELMRDLAKNQSVGGDEKGHTKENALAIVENEETGEKKKFTN